MNVGSLVSPAFVFNARRDGRVRPVPEEEIWLAPDEDATSSTTAPSHSTAWSVVTEMLEPAFAFRRRAFFKVISESQRWPSLGGFQQK
jgi:predicted cupin superfamily sugar epimerase